MKLVPLLEVRRITSLAAGRWVRSELFFSSAHPVTADGVNAVAKLDNFGPLAVDNELTVVAQHELASPGNSEQPLRGEDTAGVALAGPGCGHSSAEL